MGRILIVEDDDSLRELLQIHLRWEGHVVTEANEAAAAIRALLQQDFDLVISDVQMPYMNGLELAAAIKGDAKTAHIPVMMFTAYNSDDISDRARSLGVSLLTKPVQAKEILTEVSKMLQQSLPKTGPN